MQKALAETDPFSLIEDGHLTIKTKPGEMIPLVLNKAQRKVLDTVKQLWFEGKIIRIIVLKARQLGISTAIEALIYAITSQLENQNSLIIADDKDGSNYIFEMSKLYQEKCPAHLKPDEKKSNEKKLEFDGTHSQILIDTANNTEAGRKFTFRTVHLSEYAFFKRAKELMLGLSHSVPVLPRTIIIKETTANGFNFFKDEWDEAVNGETDYIPIFIPWYWDEDYRMSVPDGFKIGDPALGEIAKDEYVLYKQIEAEGFDNIEERLNWRRWDIRNSCDGKVEKFQQENPSTPEEAFMATGACFFDKRALVAQLKRAKVNPPLFKANILKENFKWIVRKCEDGDFTFYKELDPLGQYCIGGDACSGSGEDYASLVARDKKTNEIVATFHAKIDSDELAYRAMQMGNFLNKALVAIENEKFGFAANKKLMTIYGNIYIQRTYNKLEKKVIEKFGWDTTAVTRPMMLSQMQEEIREGSLELMDEILIKECLTFIKNPETKKAEAEEGMHDDTVIAAAIAGQIRHDDPYKVPQRKQAQPEVSRPTNAGMSFKKRYN